MTMSCVRFQMAKFNAAWSLFRVTRREGQSCSRKSVVDKAVDVSHTWTNFVLVSTGDVKV